jgi:acyl-CoA synthetase (AMP-forming)/AMP-acid ligase II
MKELVYHRHLLPAAAVAADRPGYVDGSYTATHGQHVERVLRLASGLSSQLGVRREDRFAVMSLNSHRFLELYHAAFLGAGVINPLNLRLAPKELEFILQDSGTRVCFVDQFFAPLVEKVREAAGIEQVVLLGEGDVAHDATYEDVVSAGEATVPEEPEEDDPCILMYTGGTTGLPKGVLIDNRALVLDLYKIATIWGVDEAIVHLHQTPMFHAASLGAMLSVPAIAGTTTFVPMFEPSAVLDVIEQQGVTMTVMVPTMIAMMLDHPAFSPERLSTLRTLVYGASPIPGALLDRLLALFPDLDVFQGYGMTENCGLLTVLDAEAHRGGGEALRSAGKPVLGAVVSIQDPDGNVVPVGETGEVCARAGNFMRSYWNRPEETEAAFRGGWYHTGDAGRLDEDGNVHLVDRVKDMIVTGGENVYSAEVENALSSHEAVAQVAVIGIPSEQWGEGVHAIVVRRPAAEPDEGDLREWCRERIAGFKVPKSIDIRDEPLPLSGAMKVLKRELRAPFWEGRDRTVS